MAFQSGVSLPGQVWDDWRAGTSLAGDIARLVGGGLVGIGGIKRQMDKEEADRAERAAEHARMASQFDRTLAQNDAHFNLGREDKYRLEAFKAAQKESLNGWGFDENNDPIYIGPTTRSQPLDMPKMTVPQAKADGARMPMPPPVELPPSVVPGTPGKWIGDTWSPGHDGAPPPASAASTVLGGTRPVPPLPVLKEASRRKERSATDQRDDTRIALAQSEAAARARKEGESEAAAKIAARVALNPNAPVTQQDLETLAKDPQFTTVFGGIMERERARQAKANAASHNEDTAAMLADSQIKSVMRRAAANGYAIEVPEYDMSPENRPPAKELARVAAAVEKNYDDAFRAKMADLDREIQSDTTLKADRRRFAQHQVDAYTTEIAVAKKTLADLEKRVAGQEADAPGSTKGTELVKARDAAKVALEDLTARREHSYALIHSLIGIDDKGNLIDGDKAVPNVPDPKAAAAAEFSALPADQQTADRWVKTKAKWKIP